MRLLAFDTATPATVVGLRDGSRELHARDDPAPGARPNHTRVLLGLAGGLLREAGLGWADLDRLAVGVGPGSFTGLRVGVATARGLAGAHETPLASVSSLAAVALGARGAASEGEPVLAVIDARRGEAFAAAWVGEQRVLAPSVLSPEALAAAVASLPSAPLAAGDGAIRFRDVLEGAGARVPDDAEALHRLAAGALLELASQAQPDGGATVVPEYLRNPDAKRRVA